jgi:hypothetical protein
VTASKLQNVLQRSGVFWDKRQDPILEIDKGKLKLSICKSFSPDHGYSLWRAGTGQSIDECIANMRDVD